MAIISQDPPQNFKPLFRNKFILVIFFCFTKSPHIEHVDAKANSPSSQNSQSKGTPLKSGTLVYFDTIPTPVIVYTNKADLHRTRFYYVKQVWPRTFTFNQAVLHLQHHRSQILLCER